MNSYKKVYGYYSIMNNMATCILGIGVTLGFILYKKKESISFYANIFKGYVNLRLRNMFSTFFESGNLTSTKSSYQLTYYSGSRRYIHIFPKRRGVVKINKVLCGENDVTDLFFEYLGPAQNFHGSIPTPKLLGFEDSLTLFYNNHNKVFTLDEPIVV